MLYLFKSKDPVVPNRARSACVFLAYVAFSQTLAVAIKVNTCLLTSASQTLTSQQWTEQVRSRVCSHLHDGRVGV